jgi:hypothetical protein
MNCVAFVMVHCLPLLLLLWLSGGQYFGCVAPFDENGHVVDGTNSGFHVGEQCAQTARVVGNGKAGNLMAILAFLYFV